MLQILSDFRSVYDRLTSETCTSVKKTTTKCLKILCVFRIPVCEVLLDIWDTLLVHFLLIQVRSSYHRHKPEWTGLFLSIVQKEY